MKKGFKTVQSLSTDTAAVEQVGHLFVAIEYHNGIGSTPRVFDTLTEANQYLVNRDWQINFSDFTTSSYWYK